MNRMAHTQEQGALSMELRGLLQGLQLVGGRAVEQPQADQIAQITGSYESITSMGGVLLQENEAAAISGSRRVLNQLLEQLQSVRCQ
jgi:hypothetical protein